MYSHREGNGDGAREKGKDEPKPTEQGREKIETGEMGD